MLGQASQETHPVVHVTSTASPDSHSMTNQSSETASRPVFDVHFRFSESLLCWGAPVALVGAQMAEAAPTLLAAVRRGPAVDPLVGVQVPQLLEAPPALRAGVGTLAGVHALVSLESREDGEAFPTLGTREGALGAAVDQPVAF